MYNNDLKYQCKYNSLLSKAWIHQINDIMVCKGNSGGCYAQASIQYQ